MAETQNYVAREKKTRDFKGVDRLQYYIDLDKTNRKFTIYRNGWIDFQAK